MVWLKSSWLLQKPMETLKLSRFNLKKNQLVLMLQRCLMSVMTLTPVVWLMSVKCERYATCQTWTSLRFAFVISVPGLLSTCAKQIPPNTVSQGDHPWPRPQRPL